MRSAERARVVAARLARGGARAYPVVFVGKVQPLAQKISARNATITDVARVAEVSIKTVSRVFNDEPNVRPETRDRVLAAAAELDYHPNVAARSLAARRSYLIGLAYADNNSPYHIQDLQAGIAERLAEERYRLMVLPSIAPAETAQRMRMAGRAAGLDGLILVSPLGNDPAAIAELDRSGLPYVRIAPARRENPVPDATPAPDVAMDDAAAVGELVDHLVALGHRRIAIVTGNVAHGSSHVRLAAFRAARLRHDLADDPGFEAPGDYSFASGLEAGRRLLALSDPPSAVFASNDDMAAGVLSAAHEAGVPVPARLSIVGFDDSTIAEVVWPRLTTVHQPSRDMAQTATDALIALIEDRPAPAHTVLPHRLLVRGSTGPAPGTIEPRLAPAQQATAG